MGHWSEQQGTIILPTAEVAGVKKAVREAHNAIYERVLAGVAAQYRSVGTSSRAAFGERMDSAVRGWTSGWRDALPSDKVANRGHVVRALIDRVITQVWLETETRMHVPTRADVDRVVSRATIRTTEFPVFCEAGLMAVGQITFSGRSVTWEKLADQTHRVMEYPVAAELFDALDRITWTRGSGGSVEGQDEYNAEEWNAGYTIRSWGPNAR